MNINYKKIIGAALIGASFVIVLVFILPLYNSLKPFKEEISLRQEIFSRRQKFVNKTMELKKQTEAREDDLSKLSVLLPERENLQDLLINLEDMPAKAALQIQEIKINEGDSGQDDYRALQVELGTGGPYRNLLDFVKLVEKNLRIFDIKELSLAPKEQAGAAGDLSLNVKFITYFLGASDENNTKKK